MPNIYVNSNGGNDTNDGLTWATAKATLVGAAAIDAAGDTIFVAHNHSESSAAAQASVFAGATNNPVRVVCANTSAEPPTDPDATALIATTGAAGITLNGPSYINGLRFTAGSGNNIAGIALSNSGTISSSMMLENCKLTIGSTSGSSSITIGSIATAVASEVILKNTDLTFGNVANVVTVASTVRWHGGVLAGISPTGGIFSPGSRGTTTLITGLDMSALASGVALVKGGLGATHGSVVFRNCKMPAGWTGSLISSAIVARGTRVSAYNCDSGDTNFTSAVEDYAGSIRSETVVVRTGGASDGTTPISWKMVTNANANFPSGTLMSDEIYRWNDTVGAAVTVTVDAVVDGAILKDDDIWMEVGYLGQSGSTLEQRVSDRKVSVLSAGADQETSTAVWTTTGITSPATFKLSASVTPQEKGTFIVRVFVAKPSTTVYVCPKLTVA